MITINYGISGCTACGGFSPRTVAHEVGHAMGFWHVSEGDIMRVVGSRDCRTTVFSDIERYHARIAYTRPRFSYDVDWDPLAAALFQPPAVIPPVITCYR